MCGAVQDLLKEFQATRYLQNCQNNDLLSSAIFALTRIPVSGEGNGLLTNSITLIGTREAMILSRLWYRLDASCLNGSSLSNASARL